MYNVGGVAAVLLLNLVLVSAARSPALPRIETHDNVRPAGQRSGDRVTARLRVELGSWYPEADQAPARQVYAFGEEGGALVNPAPLLRARAGTTFDLAIRNATADTLSLHGLHDRPGPPAVLRIAPGESRRVQFRIAAPGTYFYWATTDGAQLVNRRGIDSQLTGGIVIDAGDDELGDRVFIIGVESAGGGTVTRLRTLQAVVVNGRSWPHTTRINAETGDTLRMRWINASERSHTMHLHGFYFRVDSRGDAAADTSYAGERRRMLATMFLTQGGTGAITWVPERAGNWLLHCHMLDHISPQLRQAAGPHAQAESNHTLNVMSGLVVGIHVRGAASDPAVGNTASRQVRLLVQERARVFGAAPGLGFVVQRENPPAPDSITIPGAPLVLTRGEPAQITVVNRLREPTSIHWHGIELDSYFDGVAGWSGSPGRLAPAIAPGDSFVVHFTPPRAGTFIYHTHFEEDRQLRSGMFGPLIVLEPGQTFDPATDRILMFHAEGPVIPTDVSLNGSRSPSLEFETGRTYRLRVINIHANTPVVVKLMQDTVPVRWRALAKDGHDLSAAEAVVVPARTVVGVGETYDFEWTAPAPQQLRIEGYLFDRSLGVGGPVTVRPAAQAPIRGFPAASLAQQHLREQQLRAVPSADSLRARMRLLSEEPHEAGTDRSLRVAEQILARFRAFGLDARIERFEALMPRPLERRLELLGPEPYTAKLREPPLAEDKDAGDANQLPTYNAYSPDGDVTGEVVFVNYGLPEDYRVLDSLGISVRGKIVIAKYGRSWRGIKPKVAAERGAVGTLIYSDPRDDGYYVGDVYPRGPMRPPFGVQRGSVMDMPLYPGDPLSPGWASEPGARKLSMNEVRTIEPIPVLPISYEDAMPILRNLGGQVVPDAWKGALPITYHFGPGPARVRLALKFEWQTRPLYNVIARVPGAVEPDQWIIYGNHHDAWVNGAEDPISGMVALEETARSIGALLKTGWRPARTLIFAAWDGEEWGLLGSTEWAEKHKDQLRRSAVLYLNSDTNSRGFIYAAGSHSLQTFVREIARDIQDPHRGRSVLDVWLGRRRGGQQLQSVPGAPALPRDTSFLIDALGSGSDYTAFIDHVGIPALHVSYGGEQSAGVYHSIYDTFDFYRRFQDTTFAYGVIEARTTGTLMLRLADAAILPFEYGSAARTYRTYVDEIEREARRKDAVRALDLRAVRAALQKLEAASTAFEQALASVMGSPRALTRDRRAVSEVNRILYQAEQALTDEPGLPERPWYRHLIYAPGFYTGYGVKTMPGIREAVEDRPDLQVATREAARVAAALEKYAGQVTAAAERLRSLMN